MPAWSQQLRRIKPGWYLLAAALLYGVLMTVLVARQGARLQELREAPPVTTEQVAPPPETSRIEAAGLWFPIPGARLPENPSHLPNSVRPYRQGVSQGFDFYDGDSGVPVPYGAAVIASAAGTVVRADLSYLEPEPEEWQRLMEEVADGASEEELDRLRGRQVWIETDDGRTLRYAHLSALREGLQEGRRVERGWVVGYVGNSGTDEGVAGTRLGARLHFEVWQGEEFFGEGMDQEELRIAAASLFTGP